MNWAQYYFEKWGKLSKGRFEDMECARFCAAIRRAILNEEFNGIFLHIPNEELTFVKPQTALIKKIIGKISGAPDYLFIGPEHGFFIEMKAGKGRQTQSQKMFQAWCKDAGVGYYLCRSAEDALDVLKRNKCLLLK